MKQYTVKISNGNSKVGKIPNISLTPVKSCGNCSSCKDKCYALKSYRQYPNVRNAWDNNLDMVKDNPVEYFAQIDEYLTKKKPTYFRWHVSGDILDSYYLEQMILLADKHSEVKFLAFTKMFTIVNHLCSINGKEVIPDNLSIVFSMFPTMKLENPYGFPVAWCQDGNESRYNEVNILDCPGTCDSCGMCWNLKSLKKDVVFNLH